MADVIIDLPPGFRFHPRDEEIIAHYLFPKVMNSEFSSAAIGDVDLNKTEPWDLPSKAKMGEEWYFFSWRDRKYPTGTRTNRATEAGYWKATGKDKEIFGGKGVLIGMKKTLVFYKGRAPKGEKTNWVMHEFRLDGKSYAHLPKTAKDEWVVCKVYNKSPMIVSGLASMIPFGENLVESDILPPLMESDFSGDFNFFSGILEDGQDTNGRFFADINIQLPNSAYYSQIKPETTYFSSPNVVTSMGYLHQDQTNEYGLTTAIKKHCIKGEQFSTHSTVSAERNIDISLKNMDSSYNDTTIDLDSLWKF